MNGRLILTCVGLLGMSVGCGGGSTTPTCSEGESICGATCVDTGADPRHCGACDSACPANEVCAAGSCQLTCPEGQAECSGGCFTLAESDAHCGACDNACAAGEVCQDGTCALSCGAPLVACGATCRDLQTDRAHCGDCGTACGDEELCVGGSCEGVCATGLTDCGGTCRDTAVDTAHCGACDNACAAGEQCEAGTCTVVCTGFSGVKCGAACTNTDFDRLNCGACGTACAASEVCSNGVCAGSCDAALDVCGGVCTDTTFDPDNCSACGTGCPAPANAVAACESSACAALCMTGFGDCNTDLLTSGTDGCEIDLRTTLSHCGTCNLPCPAVLNGTADCANATCVVGSCDAGFDDCDNDPATGCEAVLSSDQAHCGACGNACPATDFCDNGTCAPIPPGADVCAVALDIVAGNNSIAWSATSLDYITFLPTCVTVGVVESPDIVLRYVAPSTGSVLFHFPNKPTSNRWVALVSDAPCGTLTPLLACISDWSPNFMEGSVAVTAGTTYWLYIADTSSGTLPLNNPLDIVVTETP